MVRRLILCGLGVVFAACGTARADAGWAIVRAEVEDGMPPLREICLGDTCRRYETSDDVRVAELSAYVPTGSTFEVILVGQSSGAGAATGGAPIDGCVLVEVSSDGANFVDGCDEE